ncbi:MAG: hypothetical protein Kow0090_03840 [Myxococcota bacterium]
MLKVNIEYLICPVCGGELVTSGDEEIRCAQSDCGLPFPVISGVPVLIGGDGALFSLGDFSAGTKIPVLRNEPPLRKFLKRVAPKISSNFKSKENYARLAAELFDLSDRPVVLVLGGGSIGEGISLLIDESRIELIESDIALSERNSLVCDAHRVPFRDGSLDGVVIQAVLEHLIEPRRAVSEIYRVLKSGGLVYAETPFIQQVHSGRFDFQRFTHLGHRWLFRRFEEIESGAVAGPATALAWSYRSFIASFVVERRFRHALDGFARLSSFWLKYLDRFLLDKPGGIDGASCFYFLGRKGGEELSPKELLSLYRGAQDEF